MKPSRQRRRFLLAAGSAGLAGAALLATGQTFGQAETRTIKVVAKRFEFQPGRIVLQRGVPVTLELSTLDIMMGFNAPDFHVRADIVPGALAHVSFTPTKTGEFTFLCDVFCGSGHEDMNGVIVVT